MGYNFKRTFFGMGLALALAGITGFAQQPANPPNANSSDSSSGGGWRRFDPSTAPADPAAGEAGPQAAPPAPSSAAPNSRPPASVPPELTIPAGTWISVRVNEPISSKHNHTGDSYSATLAEPLVADGYVVARRGQTIAGRVAESDEGGRVKGISHLTLELTDLSLVDGQQVPVRTELARYEAGTSHGRDAAAIAGTTGVGAAIGAAAAGGIGAAAGAGAGAIASTIGVLTTHGKETVVLPEDRLTFRTTAPLTISTARAAQVFEPVRQGDYGQQRPVLQRRVGPPPPPYYYPYGPYPYYYGPGFYGPGFYGPSVFIGGRFGRRW